jgi:hypothetical protein
MDTSDASALKNEVPVLRINDQSIIYLNETRKWGTFLSVLGFIGIGLMVLVALFIGSIMNLMSSLSPSPISFPAFALTFLYLLIALLYFFPVFYLFRFSSRMKIALEQRDEHNLTVSFSYLKSMFRFMGISAIAIISIYLLVFIGVIAAFVFIRH